MRNILEYLEKTVSLFPNKTVFSDTTSHITFQDLISTSQIIGSNLSQFIEMRNPILVLTNKKISNISLFLGVVYAGCYYIPMDIELPKSRMDSILQTSRPALVIGDQADIDYFLTLNYQFNTLSYEQLICGSVNYKNLVFIRNKMCDIDPLYVIFTSGSTGTPKGVLTSHQSVIDYIESFCNVTKIDENDVLGNQAPLDYVAAIRDIYIPLKTGASTVLIPHKMFSMPANLFKFLNEHHVTTLCWVASAFNIPVTFKAFDKVNLEFVNKVIFTGSVMSSITLRTWQTYLPNAFYMNHYGPTEITASCTYHIVDHLVELDEVLPIGKPFENTQIFVINKDNKQAAINEKGEIYVGGSCLSLGYMNSTELTKRYFVKNPINTVYDQIIYKTGDIGSIDQNGVLWFHGRLDTQIKHMGHRVELIEIENAVRSVENVTECACIYQVEKENICLFYEGSVDKKTLACKLRNMLPAFMIPRKFINCDNLPRLENGKIDLKKLKDLL